MRKLLLASSALIGAAMLAAPAFAGDLTVKISGYDLFEGAVFQESQKTDAVTGANTVAKPDRNDIAFDDIFDLNVNVTGKGSNNLDYGAMLSLWNGPDYTNKFDGSTNSVTINQAYVWMSNNWGKLMLGDAHGATDLFTYAPTVGTNQIDGDYTNFVDFDKIWRVLPSGVDNTETSTKVTYYTPVVSGFQAGITYEPEQYSEGLNSNANTLSNTAVAGVTTNAYNNVIEGALQWSGSYMGVGLKGDGLITYGEGNNDLYATLKDNYTTFGFGGQANYAGFTLGGSFTDMGAYGELNGQDKDQYTWTLGGKYEWQKAAFAINYVNAEGYNTTWGTTGLATLTANGFGHPQSGYGAADFDYVKEFQAVGFGATYTWFPGLVSGVDVVLFNQGGAYTGGDDHGEVVLLSQRLNF